MQSTTCTRDTTAKSASPGLRDYAYGNGSMAFTWANKFEPAVRLSLQGRTGIISCGDSISADDSRVALVSKVDITDEFSRDFWKEFRVPCSQSQRYLVLGLVGIVGLALRLVSGIALNKYRCGYGTYPKLNVCRSGLQPIHHRPYNTLKIFRYDQSRNVTAKFCEQAYSN